MGQFDRKYKYRKGLSIVRPTLNNKAESHLGDNPIPSNRWKTN